MLGSPLRRRAASHPRHTHGLSPCGSPWLQALRKVMCDGRSQRCGGGGGGGKASLWDHSSLDAQGLKHAVQELNMFPAIEQSNRGRGYGGSGGDGGQPVSPRLSQSSSSFSEVPPVL